MTLGERIRHEAREIGLVTAFFLTWFLLFLGLKKLLLAEYQIQTSMLGTALMGALVVAKVVVILEKTSFAGWFRDGPLFLHVLARSLAYTAVVFVVTLAEHLFGWYRETGALPGLAEIWAHHDFHHCLARNLAVGLAFFVYNSLREIDVRLGEGGLRRLFFASDAGRSRVG